MKKTFQTRGFTLIELLVVITIIAILASIALPVYSTIQERGSQSRALAQAKQVGLALRLAAGDNDGVYPVTSVAGSGSETIGNFSTAATPTNANAAFRALIPDYVPGEKIFYVPKSGWTPAAPDENISTHAEKLKGGENHWAYVPKLTDTSNPSFPLIADGFSTTVGVYSNVEAAKGAVWKGKKAIVVRNDQSAALENVRSSDFKVFGRTGQSNTADIFATASWSPALPNAPINPEE